MRKAFITSKYNCLRAIWIIKITGALIFYSGVVYPQQSLDFLSSVQCAQNSRFRLNSFEGNSSNLSTGKDWEISSLFSAYSQNSFKTNLFSISLGKHLGDHYLYARFSPGYSEDFLFNSGLQVIIKDPVRVETDLQKKISYTEDFGLGYSYTFNSSFGIGVTLRHIKQQFTEEQPDPVLTDSLNYILITNKNTNSNFWRGDVSLSYRPAGWIAFSISSSNLFIINENDEIKKPILVNNRNAWDGSVSNLKYFVKEKFDFSSALAKKILGENSNKIKNAGVELEIFEKTKILFNNIIKNILYIADLRASIDIVQFPDETIALKGGDCDDLSVCFSSLLESAGIETAFVDYKNDNSINHVNILVNTKLLPEQFGLITNNDKKIVVRKNQEEVDEIWIPIETTSLTNFETAWSSASDKFQTEAIEQMGLAKGKIQIIDVK